jgi:hypothetical protein
LIQSPISKKLISILIFTALLLALVIWLLARPAEKEPAQGNDRFGLCFISASDHLANEARYSGALAAGARWDRWPLYWHWVEAGGYIGPHEGGQHDYDALVTQEIAHGLTPVAILMGTPPGEAKRPSRASSSANLLPPASLNESIFADGSDNPGPGKTINPANVWATFVFTTVDRYRPQGVLARQQGWPVEAGIRHWEVWNEPDYYLFWQGTVEEYYRLLEVAYKSIKTADPQAIVILGGLAFYEQREWFPSLLRQAGGDPQRTYFDVFSFHHYLSVYRSEQLIQQARTALDAYGLPHIPIWITESGVSVWDDYPATIHQVKPDTPLRATITEQAAYVIQNAALAFYNGVERYYHFQLHDDCGDSPASAYGLRQNFSPHACNPAQGQPRPAYAAYQLAAAQFRHLTPLWRKKAYTHDQLAFYRPDDRSRLVALWATQGLTATLTVSATGPTAQLYWIEPAKTLSGTTGLSRSLTLTPTHGLYTLTLPPATNQNGAEPDDLTYQIGGPPFILVEADTLPPQTTVDPLPPTSPPNFWLQWQGNDPGSGIAGYEVWVSEDSRQPTLWLTDTLQTEAKFTGQVGQSYSFTIHARDRAGNEEALPAQPQAITHIAAGPSLAGVVLGPSGQPVANAVVTITGPNTQENVVTNSEGRWLPLSLPPGDYSLQAAAPAYGIWPASRRFILTNTPAIITLTVAPPVNAIAGGDFEGNQVWNRWDWAGQVNLSIDAFDGQAAARLGDGTGEATTCADGQPGQLWMLQQQVTIPTDSAPVLSFIYKNSSSQISVTPAEFEVLVMIDEQPHYLVVSGELPSAPDWTLVSQDLSTWQGQTVGLQFQVVRCGPQPYSVSLDRVSVGSRN